MRRPYRTSVLTFVSEPCWRLLLAVVPFAVVGCEAGTDSNPVSKAVSPLVAQSPLVAPAAPPMVSPTLVPAAGNSQLLRVGPPTAPAGTSASRLIDGEIIVKMRNTSHAVAAARGGLAAASALSASGASGLSGVMSRHRVASSRQLIPNAEVDHLRRLVKMGGISDVPAAIRDLSALPEVEYAEPNRVVRAFYTPNDSYFASSGAWGQGFLDLWGLQKLQISTAWDTTKGAGAVVAVIDSGLDYDHADIAANVWQNAGETGNDSQGRDKRTNGVDDDGNGLVDDWHGYDFITANGGIGDNDPMDDNGHGTHVAGTIAAVANNAMGVVGVAPLARIMPLKVLDSAGNGNLDDIVRAIYYAANQGAGVINASWGGTTSEPIRSLADAVSYAHDSKGVVFVAAAGNDNLDVGTPESGYYPANLRDAIAVAASDENDTKAPFSNYGVLVDVTAPGGSAADPLGLDQFAERTILSLLSSHASS